MQVTAYLQTEGSEESRRTSRRTLRLEAQALVPGTSERAIIRNLSTRGLLLETAASVDVGEWLFVELASGTAIAAEVKWKNSEQVGCEFLLPISQALVSSAILRADRRAPEHDGQVEEVPPQYGYVGEYEEDDPSANMIVTVSLLLALAAVFILILAIAR